ncbi:LysR substrate-binding domain-containing protein [Oleiagrimonas sp. C23AA]|uniref:LysR substrate-binding domain-containing protein n=1 Tax=Oleiagrimonas sp. C23AA TaxID=2719047 RepID=UPI001422ED3C|nr:LysR substrate-binding domain-containing protein [Oleiagrimonas sp. C23AA]NII09253.1 LysR family transcriptional regulator [Oleiagrimonas sp. C23AA]
MTPELRHLRYFLAVADELHFGRAAERLGMSQPPLSQQIRELERRIGVKLFERTNRRVALTDAGTAFRTSAQRILAQMDDAVDLAQRVQRGEAGELRIGFTASTPLTETLPRTIFAFRQAYPQVHLTLTEMNTLQQLTALHEGALQIGISRGTPLPDTLTARPLFRDPLLAVMREDHPLLQPGRRELALTELADSPFVTFSRSAGTGIHDQIIALCREAGFSPRIAQEAREAATLIGLVSAGLGVALLPASYRHLRIDKVVYVPLTDAGAASVVQAVVRADERSAPVRAFLDLLPAMTI